MGQQTDVPRRLGELPFRQSQHKHGVHLRQAHPARRGKDDAVKALGDVPHVGGAQQQSEQLGVIGGGQGFLPHHARQLVEQLHDGVPLPQRLLGGGQLAPAAQVGGEVAQRFLRAKPLQKQIDLPGGLGGGPVPGFGDEFLRPAHQKLPCLLCQRQCAGVLLGGAVAVSRRAAGEGGAPVLRLEGPCIGIVFQRALGVLRQAGQPGLEQPHHGAGIDAAAQNFQRGMHRPRGGGVLRRGGFVAEQRNVLQPELIAHGGAVAVRAAADDRHFPVGRARSGPGADGCGNGLGLVLPGSRRVLHNVRRGRVHGALRGVGRVRQQQVQFGQRAGVAAVPGEQRGMGGHPRAAGHLLEQRRHPPPAAEGAHAVIRGIGIAAEAHRHIGDGQHGRQHVPLGGVEGVELVNEHCPPRKPRGVQRPGGALHPVAGVHGGLLQKRLVSSKNQRQFA